MVEGVQQGPVLVGPFFNTPTASARSAGGSGPAWTGPAKGCAPTGLMRTRTPPSTSRVPRSTSPYGT